MTSKVKGSEGIEFPDSTVQSSAALSAFIGANQLLAANGFQKLPGGMIIQWGATTITTSAINTAAKVTVNLPIAFTTPLLAIANAVMTSATNQVLQGNASALRQSQLDLFGVSTVSATSFPVAWIAIGY